MLNGIRIYSTNPVWRHILGELGATVVDAKNVLDIDFDEIEPTTIVSLNELKSLIVNSSIIVLQNVFGENIPQLSDVQKNIIISLWRSGGMTGEELKNALGYMPNVATHTIDTAIYNMRKLYGRNFIKLENGVYKIGTV